MSQRIKRAFSLAKLARERGALRFGIADVEEPQQHRAVRFGRRRGGTPHLDDALRGGEADHPAQRLGPERGDFKIGQQESEIVGDDPPRLAAEPVEPGGWMGDAEIAKQLVVDVKRAVRTD